MQEYLAIRDAISNLGASLIEEHLHPEFFGSAYGVFEGKSGLRFRLIWDGKEGYGFLQSADSGGTWQDTTPHVSDPKTTAFAALLSLAKEFTNGHGAV